MKNEKVKIKNVRYTVADLTKKLNQFPQNLPVLVSGYENGFENLLEPEIMKLTHKPDNKYWDGEFQEVDENSDNLLKAIVLQRQIRDME